MTQKILFIPVFIASMIFLIIGAVACSSNDTTSSVERTVEDIDIVEERVDVPLVATGKAADLLEDFAVQHRGFSIYEFPAGFLVGAIGIISEDGDFMPVGTGFMVDEWRLVTKGDIARVIARKVNASGGSRPAVYLRTDFPSQTDPDYFIAPLDFLSFSEDGILALFTVLDISPVTYYDHVRKFQYEPADIDSLYEGQWMFGIDKFFDLFPNYKKSYYVNLWGLVLYTKPSMDNMDDIHVSSALARKDESHLKKVIVVDSNAIGGQGGAPMFVYDEEEQIYKLIGMIETSRTVIRVDVIEAFVKKHGVSFRGS